MARNMEKLSKEYLQLVDSGLGGLYYSDFKQIEKMCKGDRIAMLFRAMECGVAIGYRLGKKEKSNRH